MYKRSLIVCLLLILISSLSLSIKAQRKTLVMPKIISDNMVLQRNKNIIIWGKGVPMNKVLVKFGNQKLTTKVDSTGEWKVSFAPLMASEKPRNMEISSGKEKIIIKNILVGEVWIASGQSNMEYAMKRQPGFKPNTKGEDIQERDLNNSNSSLIRLLLVEKNLKSDTLPSKGWKITEKKSLSSFSAAAYYFAKTLHDSLHVPIGIISSSWGGSRIEVWIPKSSYLENPIFKNDYKSFSLDNNDIGSRYQKMISPLAPYSIKGFIWYQGESNLGADGEYIPFYYDKQKTLIESWRTAWNDETLSFYYVQLAPLRYSQRRHEQAETWKSLPQFWDIQTRCMEIPNTGMTVSTDLVEDLDDIHPSYKWKVGERLAFWALNKDYGYKRIACCGPKFRTIEAIDNKIIVKFDYAESGLKSNDGKSLSWFMIKGKGTKYEKADAIIDGDKVILSSPKVKNPTSVRFGWDEIAQPNLVNMEGLPAIPFNSETALKCK